MKTFRSIAAIFVFAAVFAISAFAQGAQPTGGKIVVIDTSMFGDDKAGITKYLKAKQTVDAEFKTVDTELQTMQTRLAGLARDIEIFKANQEKGVPFDKNAAQSKVDEADKLQRDMKFKSEDAKVRYDRRKQTVLGPITEDIRKSLQDFAKQKGYSVILDSAKLDEAGVILAMGNENADVTREFIAYFNTRPATTAAAVK